MPTKSTEIMKELRVRGLEFRLRDSGFGCWELECRVRGFGFRAFGLVLDPGLWGKPSTISGFGDWNVERQRKVPHTPNRNERKRKVPKNPNPNTHTHTHTHTVLRYLALSFFVELVDLVRQVVYHLFFLRRFKSKV